MPPETEAPDVTPEMIQAGLDVLDSSKRLEFIGPDDGELVRKLFVAMLARMPAKVSRAMAEAGAVELDE